MIRLLVYVIVGIALLYIFTEIIKFLSAINGTKSQMIRDRDKFIKSIDRSDLVDWLWAELTTLSMKIDFGLSKYDMISSAQEGAFLSIYSENIGHMMSKKYGDRELLFVVTNENTYELFEGDNQEVTLIIDKNKPLPIKFSDSSMSFRANDTSFTLTKNTNRGEIFINDNSVLITNDSQEGDESMRRLVQVMPDKVNTKDHDIVKFLLLFYLIWRQDSQ